MTSEQLACICHEANRAYCLSLGDDSQPLWDGAPAWQRQSAINGVSEHLLHPSMTPADSHQSWLKEKEAAGWKYGLVKDPEKKEHPCFVAYTDLPADQQAKDSLFKAIIDALRHCIKETANV